MLPLKNLTALALAVRAPDPARRCCLAAPQFCSRSSCPCPCPCPCHAGTCVQRYAYAPPPPPHCFLQLQAFWPCPKCTFHNTDMKSKTCGMCHSTRPVAHAPAPAAASPKPSLSSALAAASLSGGPDAAAVKAASIIKDAEAKAAAIIKAAENSAAQAKAKVEAEAAADALAKEKIEAATKAAALAKKAAADRAAAEANKADNAAAEPVHIGGATGSTASKVNGIYDPTSELSSGRRVYKRRDANIWIELFEGQWQVKPASGKGKDGAWAFYAAGCALEQCTGSTWQVYNDNAWAAQASVKLMPESRAAFELVHRPTRQLFTCSYQHINLAWGINSASISSDFRWISLSAYGRSILRLSIDTQELTCWPESLGNRSHGSRSFSASGRYFIPMHLLTESKCIVYESESGVPVLRAAPEGCSDEAWSISRINTNFHCLSSDEKLVFCSKADDFQVLRLTGEMVWHFSLSDVAFVKCLPDNDTFVVLSSETINKYSLSSRALIMSGSFPCQQLIRDAINILPLGCSPDGRWISYHNLVLDTRTLTFDTLPFSAPVFFLPGSQTAIINKHVFSLAEGRWMLRVSPMPHAFPLVPDRDPDCDDQDEFDFRAHTNDFHAYNLVTRASGSDIFFGNLSFAFVIRNSNTSVSVHLQHS